MTLRLRLLGAGALLVACGSAPIPVEHEPWQWDTESGDYVSRPNGIAEGGGGQPASSAAGEPNDNAPSRTERARPTTRVAGDPSLLARHGSRPPLEVLEGRASYYHDSLAGNTTANGDIYDLRAFTAASRELPFGTIVRVTRVDNERQVLVRVNDRGPFGDHRRILDLSRAAAEALDMIRAGVVDIRAEILHQP